MLNKYNQIKLGITRLDSRHVRLALVILSLTLFVLGAGAPEAGDTWGG